MSFNFMAVIPICSDFGAQKYKVSHCFHCFPIYLPWSDGTGCHSIWCHHSIWCNLKPSILMEGFWKTPDSNMRVPLEFCFHAFKELWVPIHSKKKNMLCIIAMAFRTELSWYFCLLYQTSWLYRIFKFVYILPISLLLFFILFYLLYHLLSIVF